MPPSHLLLYSVGINILVKIDQSFGWIIPGFSDPSTTNRATGPKINFVYKSTKTCGLLLFDKILSNIFGFLDKILLCFQG